MCDDSRDVRRDFTCHPRLLLDQMGYFRDITAGQSLEDVDISVHCDVAVFQWLMDWIKGEKPNLQPSNVMSVLVSANFLQMSELVTEALDYAHHNMAKVLAVTHNFSCLGEPLFSRYYAHVMLRVSVHFDTNIRFFYVRNFFYYTNIVFFLIFLIYATFLIYKPLCLITLLHVRNTICQYKELFQTGRVVQAI